MNVSEIIHSSKESVYTGDGYDLLKSTRLGQIALAFCNPETNSDLFLSDEEFIGSGNHSIVWNLENTAIKLSTYSSGKKTWINNFPQRPENLIDQFHFLNNLDNYLNKTKTQDIVVPKQYFALKNYKNEFLKAEEIMTDWATIAELSKEIKLSNEEHNLAFRKTKIRINKLIGSSIIKLGISDAGLEKNDILHGGNILMPRDSLDIDSAKICIIDQPAKGIRGKMALSILRRLL